MGLEVTFKWEVALGHILQLCAGIAAVVTIYYTLLMDLRDTQLQVSYNSAAISKLQDDWRTDAAARERRMMEQIVEIKEDLRWLVRNRVEAPHSGH